MIVDTHCHLDFKQFDADRDEVIFRAVENGVRGMILIGIDPESWKSTESLCAGASRFWRTVGLHPNSVRHLWNDKLATDLRREILAPGIVGVGETGIDLYRSSESLEIQREAFEVHLQIAADANLPIVIHQRAAEDAVLEVLRRHKPVEGVMHCFSGNWEFASACLDLGLHLGIGGVATYKSAADTREAIKAAPLDRLLLETDAPFLAPQPERGKRNEPSFLPHVVEVIASCTGKAPAEIEQATTENAMSLFGIDL